MTCLVRRNQIMAPDLSTEELGLALPNNPAGPGRDMFVAPDMDAQDNYSAWRSGRLDDESLINGRGDCGERSF